MYVCMHACIYACMHACMYICMHVCMHVCIHVCMHACICVCVYMCKAIIKGRYNLERLAESEVRGDLDTSSCSNSSSVRDTSVRRHTETLETHKPQDLHQLQQALITCRPLGLCLHELQHGRRARYRRISFKTGTHRFPDAWRHVRRQRRVGRDASVTRHGHMSAARCRDTCATDAARASTRCTSGAPASVPPAAPPKCVPVRGELPRVTSPDSALNGFLLSPECRLASPDLAAVEPCDCDHGAAAAVPGVLTRESAGINFSWT